MKEALVRELKRKTLSLMHNVSYRTQRRHINALLEGYDASVVHCERPERIRTVAFVITRMVRFHGGQTSILRLGTQLEDQGFKVVYLVYKPQSVKEMKYCAGENLKDYKGKFSSLHEYWHGVEDGRFVVPDVVVATSWDTVSYTKLFSSYKMYFVQDYEPYFYNYGEEFLMCRSTYEQGLHMVSLGAWNKDMIERETKPVSPVDAISFPYERSEYPHVERDFEEYRNKRKLTLAVYVKFYGKRLPNLIPYMMKNTADKLKKHGIELEVLYFGEAKTFKAAGGTNLGQLNKEELYELYTKADFGMVASMSNISLVPYEMHAAGLPLVEFSDGTYPYFFPKDTALLTSVGEQDIANLLLDAMQDPSGLKAMQEKAMAAMQDLSWERTGREFAEILRKLELEEWR